MHIRHKVSLKHFVEQLVGNAEIPVQTKCTHQYIVGFRIGHHPVTVSVLEDVERRPEKVPVRNENLKNAIQVFDGRPAVELHHSIKHSEGFLGQIGFAVDFDQVGKEGGGDGVVLGLEAEEEVIDEGEVFGPTELENESEVGGVGVAEIWVAGGVVEDFFGEERVGLGGDELLDSGRRADIGRLVTGLGGVEEGGGRGWGFWREGEVASGGCGGFC